MSIKKPLFFAKAGFWGQYGWKKVSFWRWTFLQSEHVTKVRWVKCSMF